MKSLTTREHDAVVTDINAVLAEETCMKSERERNEADAEETLIAVLNAI